MKLGIRLLLLLTFTTMLSTVTTAPSSANCWLMRQVATASEKCGGSTVASFGLSIGVPLRGSGSGYAGRSWGSIKGIVGITVAAVAIEDMITYVKAHDVPWPNSASKTAKKQRKVPYNLYQIWMRRDASKKKDLYKYGITRSGLGRARPASQIGTCNNTREVVFNSCHWRWVRVKITGYYRARGWEATYCARYVARKGHPPLGMKKCL